jgi:hypothetical protein
MAGASPRISSVPERSSPARLVLQRLLDDQQQLLDLEGLEDVVVGAELHGLHGVLGGGVGGHHHHLGLG